MNIEHTANNLNEKISKTEYLEALFGPIDPNLLNTKRYKFTDIYK